MLRKLLADGLCFPPFDIDIRMTQGDVGFDGEMHVHNLGLDAVFAFVCASEWNLVSLQRLIEQAPLLDERRVLPMIVFPHLTETHLQDLQDMGLSGLDLSGNGLLFDPPRLFVLRSGAKTRFKPVAATAAIYHSRHISSLVPRVLLCERHFTTVQGVLVACQRRMMPLGEHPHVLSLPTVSKALSQLRADLIVSRLGTETTLRDPDRLLMQLERAFEMPAHVTPLMGKTALDGEAIWARLHDLRPSVRAVVTGRGTAGRYTGLAGPERLQLYVSDARAVEQALALRPTRSFPNIELLETPEESPYFDARAHEQTFWSSPVQTYLELQAGDARERDVAQKLRSRLIQDAARHLEV